MALFNHFSLQTPERVELEFTLAGIGNRAYALIIDYLALGTLIIILMIGWGLLYYFLWEVIHLDNYFGGDRLGLWLLAIQILILFSCYVGYFIFFETLWQGKTPGKRFTKIRVIRDDGRPIGLPQATLRALFRPIDDLLYIGMFLIIFGKQEKRIGDWIAGTLVIQEVATTDKKATTWQFASESQSLAEILLAKANLSQLIPDQFVVIREYLQRRDSLLPDAKRALSLKLAHQAKEIINFPDIPVETSANHFLEAIYLAYQHQELTPPSVKDESS